MKINARPASNIGTWWVLPCILIFLKSTISKCIVLMTMYSIGRMICKWRIFLSVLYETWHSNYVNLRVTISLSARILKMWFTDPFRHIWIFSVHRNYTPVKFLHISYFNLVTTLVWSVIDGALNLFLCYLVLAVTPGEWEALSNINFILVIVHSRV